MFVKIYLLVFFMVLAWKNFGCYGYGTGAPEERCDNMTPGHPAVGQQGPSPFRLVLSKFSYIPFEQVQVTINATRPFSGFMLQARRADDFQNYIGYFEPAPETKFVCGQNQGLTHTSGTLKDSLSFYWRAPFVNLARVVFRATVVQDYFTFYIDIRSDILEPIATTSTSTTTTTTKTTTTTMTTTTPTTATAITTPSTITSTTKTPSTTTTTPTTITTSSRITTPMATTPPSTTSSTSPNSTTLTTTTTPVSTTTPIITTTSTTTPTTSTSTTTVTTSTSPKTTTTTLTTIEKETTTKKSTTTSSIPPPTTITTITTTITSSPNTTTATSPSSPPQTTTSSSTPIPSSTDLSNATREGAISDGDDHTHGVELYVYLLLGLVGIWVVVILIAVLVKHINSRRGTQNSGIKNIIAIFTDIDSKA